MQKPLVLSIAVCLGLAGCQLVEKSRTWETVMSVHPGDSFRDADPSASYAEKLHRVLLEEGVEHIVVTYQYHYYTRDRAEALGTHTAVVYRDDADTRYPWWLKDDTTATPIWLPNGDLDQQLSFYVRRPTQAIEKQVYPARGGSGKAALAHAHPAPVPPKNRAAERPQPVTKIVQAKPAPALPAKPFFTTSYSSAEKPTTSGTTASPATVTRIQHPPTTAIAKPQPSGEPAPTPIAATHPSTSWAPPTAFAPIAEAPEAAPREEHLEKLFRARHGTSYDPASATDRRKMEQLKHGLVGSEVSGERGFRRAVDGGETRYY